MTPNLESISKTFYEYGPFALVFVLLYPIEKKTRTLFNLASFDRRFVYCLYSLVWVGIFVNMIFAVWVWREYHSEFTVKGDLVGLSSGDRLESQANFYTSADRGDDGVLRRYLWRLVSAKQFDEENPFMIFVDINPVDPGSSDKSEKILFYELGIKPEYLNSTKEVHLYYERESDTLRLRYGSEKPVQLSPSSRNRRPQITENRISVLGRILANFSGRVVYAQKATDYKDLTDRLESSDVYTRLVAREQLAKLGDSARPFVEEVLTDGSTSGRLRLGVISALNQMVATSVPPLSEATICSIAKEASGYESTLRDEASNFMERQRLSVPPRCNTENVTFCIRPERLTARKRSSFAQTASGFFYLENVSSSSVADIYFVAQRPPQDFTNTSLSHAQFKEFITKLVLKASGDLNPGEYREFHLNNGDRRDLRDPSGALVSIKVVKTHAYLESVDADVCR